MVLRMWELGAVTSIYCENLSPRDVLQSNTELEDLKRKWKRNGEQELEDSEKSFGQDESESDDEVEFDENTNADEGEEDDDDDS